MESEYPKNLQQNLSILSESEILLANKLLSIDQQHLFENWENPGINDEGKHAFFEQLRNLDAGYPNGGIIGYYHQSKRLLLGSKLGENPLSGWSPEIPKGISLEPFSSEFDYYEEIGIKELGKCGFVLVAGGLGERLGYSGIKVELPVETTTHICYLELYIQTILAIQKRHSKDIHNIPLAIMVSDDTFAGTISLLERNNYFGMEIEQITIMKQEKVLALSDSEAHFSLLPSSSQSPSYLLDTKPHGHGDVHSLLFTTGTAQRWKDLGIQWIHFFQDTNGLAFYSLPVALGVSKEHQWEMNSIAIPRKAKQPIGAITRLLREGQEMIVNVEYNQLDPLLQATLFPGQGDQNDPETGCSPFPGNINQLLFRLEAYLLTLQRSCGVMGEFVNPKYQDSNRNVFKKPTRLECMMQDYPKALLSELSIHAPPKIGFTVLPSWFCYSPCKNNLSDAAQALRSSVPPASASSAESDQYFFFAECLRRWAEITRRRDSTLIPPPHPSPWTFTSPPSIISSPPLEVGGITFVPSPRVVVLPSTAISLSELKTVFPNPERLFLSPQSTLVVQGPVVVETLSLCGFLRVAAKGEERIVVRAGGVGEGIESQEGKEEGFPVINQGQVLVPLEALPPSSPPHEIDLMRGYQLVTREVKNVEVGREFSGQPPRGDLGEGEGTPAKKGLQKVFVFNGQDLTPLLEGGEVGGSEQEARCPSPFTT